jgi:Ca-activated chloride channel family protein
MRFEQPIFLWLLLLIPFLIVLFIVYIKWRDAALKHLGSKAIIAPLMNGFIPKRIYTKFVFLLCSILFLIITLANPQQENASINIKRKGIDVMYVLDLSKSMLATDIAPTRLDRAKQTIKKTLDIMSGNRVGLVIFAGSAYLQVPLTTDYNALKMYLDNLNPDLIPQQGTILSEALELAEKSFASPEKKYKAIVLISDGEDHENEAIKSAIEVAKNGTVIYTVGVGNPKGAVLIDSKTNEPKVDANGNPVVTKLNEKILIELSKATNGTYFLLNNINSGAEKLLASFDNMEKMDLGSQNVKTYRSFFQYSLILSIICLLLVMFLPIAYNNKSL